MGLEALKNLEREIVRYCRACTQPHGQTQDFKNHFVEAKPEAFGRGQVQPKIKEISAKCSFPSLVLMGKQVMAGYMESFGL